MDGWRERPWNSPVCTSPWSARVPAPRPTTSRPPQGARRAGGTAVGLLPGPDPVANSPEHTVLVPAGLGELRNGLAVRAADSARAVRLVRGALGR